MKTSDVISDLLALNENSNIVINIDRYKNGDSIYIELDNYNIFMHEYSVLKYSYNSEKYNEFEIDSDIDMWRWLKNWVVSYTEKVLSC